MIDLQQKPLQRGKHFGMCKHGLNDNPIDVLCWCEDRFKRSFGLMFDFNPFNSRDTTHSTIQILLRLLPLLLHIIAFTILYLTKYTSKFNQVQRFFLLNLSISEMSLCFIPIIRNFINVENIRFYLYCLQLFGFNLMFYLSYAVLTVDRFLVVFLHVRYKCIVSLQRVRRLFACFYGMAFLGTITLCLLHSQDEKELSGDIAVYFWPLGDTLCTLIAVGTYMYIFLVRKKLQKSIGINNSSRSSAMSSSTLLIVSYVVTFAIPDFLSTAFAGSNTRKPEGLKIFINASYCVGFGVDALIYIFALKSIHLPRIFKSTRSIIHKFSRQQTVEVEVTHESDF